MHSPSRPLPSYAGTYTNEMMGELAIGQREGALTIAYGIAPVGTLGHWHLDAFQAQDWPAPGNDTLLVFRFDVDAKVVGVEVVGLGTFDRRPEPQSAPGEQKSEP